MDNYNSLHDDRGGHVQLQPAFADAGGERRIDEKGSPLVERAVQDLNVALEVQRLGTSMSVTFVNPGRAAIIECAGRDPDLHLATARLRETHGGSIVLVVPDISFEERLLARLHGADHIVVATDDARELRAVLGNEINRAQKVRVMPRAGEENQLWSLVPGRWALVAPNGKETRLTRSEHAVLDLLISRAGQIQPRHVLRAAISGDPRRERVLDAVLSRLRRKVWDCARSELPLRSARGEGYVFAGAVAGQVTGPATASRLN